MTLKSADPEFKAPLGSVWKLMVHAYLLDNGIMGRPYTCQGKDPDEIFCCEKGKSIDRRGALARSCGPYYKEQLRSISHSHWKTFWQGLGPQPTWLLTPPTDGGQEVKVKELLQVLSTVQSLPTFPQLKRDLVAVGTEGTLKGEWHRTGGKLFMKTWTWPKNGKFEGGVAGWNADGEAFWVGGSGSGREVFIQAAPSLSSQFESKMPAAPLVNVAFFAKYPLARVLKMPEGREVTSGVLRGDHRIEFKNGSSMKVHSDGQMILENGRLRGLFPREEYVARVIEREGTAKDPESARTLAILIRTYLEAQGKTEEGYTIIDSSERQRVGPSTPGKLALEAALFTRDLVLEGEKVNYSDKTWEWISELSMKGLHFEQILEVLYPGSRITLSLPGRSSTCQRQHLAETFLERSLPRWRGTLARQPGYEEVKKVEVCQMNFKRPYSDLSRNRIYLKFDETEEARTTLAHEYLHLGFKHHPNTQNEAFIEELAQSLNGVRHE